MKLNLQMSFLELVTREFDFLVTNYGYEILEENPWHVSCRNKNITIILEFDGRSLGCWIERKDLKRLDRYRALGVEVISKCLGYDVPKELLFRTREEMLIENTKQAAALIKKYCLNIIEGDFSVWDTVVMCLGKTD